MSFELSFSSEFFQDEDDCEFGTTHTYPGQHEYPTTLFKALTSLPEHYWDEYCEHEHDGAQLDVHEVMAYIKEVNACTDLSSPVRVHMSKDGWYTCDVWDAIHAQRMQEEDEEES